MNYTLIRNVVDLLQRFDNQNTQKDSPHDLEAFLRWACSETTTQASPAMMEEPDWEGKEAGRSPESVISTLIVHMNRYGKTYSRSAIFGSDFSTQEEFIYLITLTAFGPLTKMDLIRKNVQDKPAGILIINRLLQQGWVEQVNSPLDKRSKVLKITPKGSATLQQIKGKINQATQIVSGNLSKSEKMELIRLLQKLEAFHHPIFLKNIERDVLLDHVSAGHLTSTN